jgi:hypothetical protein
MVSYEEFLKLTHEPQKPQLKVYKLFFAKMNINIKVSFWEKSIHRSAILILKHNSFEVCCCTTEKKGEHFERKNKSVVRAVTCRTFFSFNLVN